MGWLCPSCGMSHGPDVVTCPTGPSERLGDTIRRANKIGKTFPSLEWIEEQYREALRPERLRTM